MFIHGPFGRIQTTTRQQSATKGRKYTHLKGKKSAKVVKTARLYAKCSDRLQQEILTYSEIKGKVMTCIAAEKKTLARLKADLKSHRDTIKSLPNGQKKKLLRQKAAILLGLAKETKVRLTTARAQLKKLTAQHKKKYNKLNTDVQRLGKYLKKHAPSLKAVTRKPATPKKKKTTKAKRAAAKKTSPSTSASRKYTHLAKGMDDKTKRIQDMLGKWQEDLQNTIAKYSSLKADIMANIAIEKDSMKEMRATLRKNKAALKKFKKGSLERTRVAKQTALLLTKYKHANNRKLASEKLLIAIERKHEITYMQLTLGIGKMEHVLDRLPKN